jgi:hypothetical protein
MATTAFGVSAKVELLQAMHCFQSTKTPTSTMASGAATVTAMSSIAGLVVGMPATHANLPAGTVLARFLSATSVELSKVSTGVITAAAITFSGDVLKLLLIKNSPTRTFDGTQTNVGTPGSGAPTATNVGTDETSGAGYTSGGFTLTNVDPSNPSAAVAIATFAVNPSWAGATFGTSAAVIYNTSVRGENVTNRSFSVHDLGGAQTIGGGTFTLTIPTADAANALLRIT